MNLIKLLIKIGSVLHKTDFNRVKINITKDEGKYTISKMYSDKQVNYDRPDGAVLMEDGIVYNNFK